MDEYIERKKAYSLAKKIVDAIASGNYNIGVFGHDILDWIDDLPAADVRPVVLCRECKYAQMAIDGLCKYCDRLTEIGVDDAVYLPEDFFCAAGEKKEES